MNKFIDYVFLALIISCGVGFFVSVNYLDQQAAIHNKQFVGMMYDCRIAEISPDVPLAVKQECRKRMERK
jgi:hypothetical protein